MKLSTSLLPGLCLVRGADHGREAGARNRRGPCVDGHQVREDNPSQRAARARQPGQDHPPSSTSASGIMSARVTSGPERTGFAHLFEHLLFNGS